MAAAGNAPIMDALHALFAALHHGRIGRALAPQVSRRRPGFNARLRAPVRDETPHIPRGLFANGGDARLPFAAMRRAAVLMCLLTLSACPRRHEPPRWEPSFREPVREPVQDPAAAPSGA